MTSEGSATIVRLVEAAQSMPHEPPLPLVRELPPAHSYPTAALGPLRAAAAAIDDIVQAPIAIAGQSVLAAAALATQAHANVILPTQEAKPLSLYCATVAASEVCSRSEHFLPLKRNKQEHCPG
jgi:hypothetical protein